MKFHSNFAAGAHGEWTALMIFKAYHLQNGDAERDEVIVPDSAHGTNPASAAFAGFKSVTVKSNEKGEVDIAHLKEVVSDKTAAIMLTNPNTLGIFETNIMEIRDIVHEAGAYYTTMALTSMQLWIKYVQETWDLMLFTLIYTKHLQGLMAVVVQVQVQSA